MTYKGLPPKDLSELEQEFYEKLTAEHNYKTPQHFKIPGTSHGVKKGSVEVRTIAELINPETQKSAMRIDIGVPIDMNLVEELEAPLFRSKSCAGKVYLANKKDLFVGTRLDLANILPEVLGLTEEGIKILKTHKDKIIKRFEKKENTLLKALK